MTGGHGLNGVPIAVKMPYQVEMHLHAHVLL